MKIIDNRYKIEKILEDRVHCEAYLVSDLWEDNKKRYMKLYNNNAQYELISYFQDNFIHLSSINHEYLLSSERFRLVSSIDTKKTNMLLYYYLSEYIEGTKLVDIKHSLALEERLRIILDIILVIDYLHFRGITYKLLNPSNIYILKDNSIKITDIATIIEKTYHGNYDDFTRHFLAPEILISNDKENRKVDYYSLGILMEYLLIKDFFLDDTEGNLHNAGDSLNDLQKQEIVNIIEQLTKNEITFKNLSLTKIADKIIEIFHLDYSYDLVKSRSKLFFENNLIGRSKEITRLMEIDEKIFNGANELKGLIVEADFGIGKSRLLSEMRRKLEFKGRDVYFIEVHDTEGNDLLDMSNILKQSIKDTPTDILDKYGTELSRILPELRLYVDDNICKSMDERLERFRLYNRIANYFNELSKERIIYLIIDDLQKCNNNFLLLLDYLINNISSNNLFFIFSFEENHGETNLLVDEKLKEWKSKSFIEKIHLHKFDLEEIGKQVRNILGISYIPYELSSVLFKESNGNPRYIEYIIKHLYNIGEIYMNVAGIWYIKADSYSDLYFPADIDDAFEKQINIIREKYLEIFKVMSIFQDVLYKKTLKKMLDMDIDLIESQINELKTLRLIDEKLADWGYSYNINSSELKKLIYHEMTIEEKTALHKKAAEAIAESDSNKFDNDFEELIFHLIKSNQKEKGLNLILDKVDRLENRYSSHARLLLEMGYNLVKDTGSKLKLEILSKIVDIYFRKGESEKGNRFLNEYQKEATETKDSWHIIKGKNTILDDYFRKAQDDLALIEINEIEEIAKENNIIEGKIIALTHKARFGIRSGDLDGAEKQLLESIDISRKYNIKTYMGTIYNRLGLAKYLRGDLDGAVKYYEKSIIHHQEFGDFVEATRPINNIANIYVEHYADLDRAMENYKKGYEIASKYGIKEVEIVFLINIANIYYDEYDCDKALEYLIEAKKGAQELQDLNILFYIYNNLASIYLFMSEYSKVYECYEQAKYIFDTKQIVDIDVTSYYHNVLGELFECMGQWDKAVEHSHISSELCKDFNNPQYLQTQCRILRCKFFGESYFNKLKIETVLNAYEETRLIHDRRKALLYFSAISILHGDMDYAKVLMDRDKVLVKSLNFDYLQRIRESILHFMGVEENSIDKLIKIAETSIDKNFNNMDLFLNMAAGIKLYNKSEYKKALKYLLEALDIMYRISMRIPNDELRISYIRSRKGDQIKEKITSILRKEFNAFINYLKLDDINANDLYDYFDITDVIDIIGSEDFLRITQLDYYGNALDINNIQTLVSKFKGDFKYNLDLILGFIGKETFAKRGYIFRYDEEQKNVVVLSHLGNDVHGEINKNIIKLADRSKHGFYINSAICETRDYRHKEFLTDDIKGIICVPLIFSEGYSMDEDRRKPSFDESKNLGYIYLETDRVFNRFDLERLDMVRNLTNLISINLNNHNLRLIATTDKLTGTLTRKYYEGEFEQLIANAKSSNSNFSVLMLDIDRFKRVNDSYGHRKGDEILKHIGHVLNSTVRSSDIVARYGGEEFVILIKNTREKEAYNIAEKIRENILSLKVPGIEYSITVSIGISLFPQHSQFKEELIEKADQALYYAKETGRNKVALWKGEMDNTLNRMDKLAGIITGSIDEDNRNILAIMDVIALIRQDINIKDKIYKLLGRILETIDAETATMIYNLDKEKTKSCLTRARFNDEWVDTPLLNSQIINRVIKSKKGEFLIDWENLESIDSLSGLPNWQSIIILPLIKDEEVNGVLYITTPLKKKEFNFNNFNLSKTMANIFASILQETI